MLGRSDHLTYKGNLGKSRHGWLRLTPAYSVHLVGELLDQSARQGSIVLDPFCGTGTTALVCAERGIAADTTDINPFLSWLARVKTTSYSEDELHDFLRVAARVADGLRDRGARGARGDRALDLHLQETWTPALFQIEKWWDPATLAALGRAMACIHRLEKSEARSSVDLLKVAFCKTMIERANVSFGHQSMSFRKGHGKKSPQLSLIASPEEAALSAWESAVHGLVEGARSPVASSPRVILCDARDLTTALEPSRYDCIITSPPYPNRMSYIRELRPYMYWLGYLADGKAAGALDYKAIGGTWGSATSKVGKWRPEQAIEIPFDDFGEILRRIAEHSDLLSRYVHKYFYDMVAHATSLYEVIRPGGIAHYIVGNSKFYDVLLPVEQIFAAIFESAGFSGTTIRTIRKRSSKKELFEFVVSAKRAS